jgi:hypothetical protein
MLTVTLERMFRMKIIVSVLMLLVIAGCSSDIVVMPELRQVQERSIYIQPLKTENDSIGRVLRDVIEKEFARQSFKLVDESKATIIISGSAFLTARSLGSQTIFGGSTLSTQAIESVSLVAKDTTGNLLVTASFDNKDRLSASKLGREFGKALADKIK